MTKATRAKQAQEKQEDMPEVTPVERQQVVPVGSMDVDATTGAPLHIGVPETDDDAAVGEFINWLQERAEADNEDSMARLAESLRKANSAESVAEALRDKETVSGADFVGRPFMAHGFKVYEGDYEGSDIPYFASMDVTTPEYPGGVILNCGGAKILVHLMTLERLNAFPIPLCITGKKTRKGFTVLSFDVLEQNRG